MSVILQISSSQETSLLLTNNQKKNNQNTSSLSPVHLQVEAGSFLGRDLPGKEMAIEYSQLSLVASSYSNPF